RSTEVHLLLTVRDFVGTDPSIAVRVGKGVWSLPVAAGRVARFVTLSVRPQAEDDGLYAVAQPLHLLGQRGERQGCIPGHRFPAHQLSVQIPFCPATAQLTDVLYTSVRHARRGWYRASHNRVLHGPLEVGELQAEPPLQCTHLK